MTEVERAQRYADAVPNSSDGTRNTDLNGLAFRLLERFDLSEAEHASLCLYWNAKNSPPLPERETKATIHSAWVGADRKHAKGTKRTETRRAHGGPAFKRQTGGPPPDKPQDAAPAPLYPGIRDMADVLHTPPQRPAELIEGLAFAGSKIFLTAPSKARKTFLQLDIAISIALGMPWLGHTTRQGPVLFVNLELGEYSFWARVSEILRVRRATLPFGSFHVWHLRGQNVNIEDLEQEIRPYVRDCRYALLDFDPVYKLWGGRSENAANEVGDLLGRLEVIGHSAGAATLCCHHFAKGNASGKEVIDRGAGSGVIGRDSDLILTLTPHEAEDCFTLEYIARDFAPTAPTVIRWCYPTFHIDEDLDPADLKKQFGTAAPVTASDVLEAMTGIPRTRDEIQGVVANKTHRGINAVRGAFRDALNTGLVKFEDTKRPGTNPIRRYYK